MGNNDLTFKEVVKVGAGLVGAAIQDSQVREVQATQEFQDEVERLVEELEWDDNNSLLFYFHTIYAEDDGKGVVLPNSTNRMDELFVAYKEVFKRRNIRKQDIRCPYCDKKLGYRMYTIKFDEMKEEENTESNIRKGHWECRCGKYGIWEFDGSYGGDTFISVYKY